MRMVCRLMRVVRDWLFVPKGYWGFVWKWFIISFVLLISGIAFGEHVWPVWVMVSICVVCAVGIYAYGRR